MSRCARAARQALLALTLLPVPSLAGDLRPPPGNESEPGVAQRQGWSLYRQRCVRCHGRDYRLPRGLTKSIFLNSVRGGKGLMPPFGEALTSAEAELLWSYVNAQISDSNQQH